MGLFTRRAAMSGMSLERSSALAREHDMWTAMRWAASRLRGGHSTFNRISA
jgi:hypothetical protein